MIKLVVGNAQLTYPRLGTPKKDFDDVTDIYSFGLMFEKGSKTAENIMDAVQQAVNEYNTANGSDYTVADFKHEKIKDGDLNGKPEYENKWYINFKTAAPKRPKLVDKYDTVLTEPETIQSAFCGGGYAHAVLAFACDKNKFGFHLYVNCFELRQSAKEPEAFGGSGDNSETYAKLDAE